MGQRMVARLLAAGHAVIVWNRTPQFRIKSLRASEAVYRKPPFNSLRFGIRCAVNKLRVGSSRLVAEIVSYLSMSFRFDAPVLLFEIDQGILLHWGEPNRGMT